MVTWLIPFLAALGAGMLSVWGVGGGTLLLLVMTLFLGVEQGESQAVNLLFFLPTAGVGLLIHRKNGLLDRQIWRRAALPGTLAALAGAVVALAVDVAALRKPFGLLLLWGGGSVLWSAWKNGEK